jgi:DNA-binding NarL/FixJ family response regulator
MIEPAMLRLLLVASAPALRAGLRSLLNGEQGMEIVAESWGLDDPGLTGIDADIFIFVPAPASSLDELEQLDPSLAILILSDDPLHAASLAHSGRTAWGILPLESTQKEMLAALQSLGEGLIVGPPALIRPLFNPRKPRTEFEDAPPATLTEREIQVLSLLAQGQANKQIALHLGISDHTVKFHVASIYTKLNVTNRTEAVRHGVRQGLVTF